MPAIRIKQGEASMEMNMTPMIDVIFQLIIFFMCSIHFKALEGKLQSYLPMNKGIVETEKEKPPKEELDEARISLIYSPDRAPLMTRIKVGTEEIPDWDALSARVASIADMDRQKVRATGRDPMPFKIDAQPKIPAQAVVNALNICKKAGISHVEFAARQPPGQRPDSR